VTAFAATLRDRTAAAPLNWFAGAAAVAIAIGAVAAVNVKAALGLSIVVAVGMASFLNPASILAILMASIFVELITIGGVTISRAIAPIAAFVVIIQLMRGRARLPWAPPLVWTCAYTLWAVASGLWTVSVAGTVYLLSSLVIALAYMLAFATLLQTRRQLETILYVLVVSSLLVGGTSFLAYFGKLHLTSDELQGGRSQGGVGDPSFFAAFQLIALPLVVVMAAYARRRWVRTGLYVTLLVIIGSILTSLSRGGFIALALLLILLVLLPARTLFRSPRHKALALLVVALGTTAVSIRASGALVARIQTIYGKGNDKGSSRGSGRVNIWLAGRTTIEERPILGLGYGAFQYRSTELMLRTPGVDLRHWFFRKPGSVAHNTYVGTWAELGLIGLLLYGGVMVSTGIALRRVATRAREVGAHWVRGIANALILGLITWSITSFFLSMETARAFWILVGLALALPRLLENEIAEGEAAKASP
jgi:O-antigen ligase